VRSMVLAGLMLGIVGLVPLVGLSGQAITVAQTTEPRQAEADRLLDEGLQHYQVGGFESAIQSWQQALVVYREIKDRKNEVGVLANLGSAYQNLGNYDKAIAHLEEGLALARKMTDGRGESAALGKLGNVYHDLSNNAKAIDYHEQALAIAQKIDYGLGEAYALGNLGNDYQSIRNYAKAIDYHERTLVIVRRIHDRRGEGYTLGNLGNSYSFFGNSAKAIDYHEQQLTIARERYDPVEVVKALNNLGTDYIGLGDYAKAVEYHKLSLVIARGIKVPKLESEAMSGLGNVYQSLGNYIKAIDYYEQYLALARKINSRSEEGAALGGLGNAYLALGDYAKAIDYHEQSLAITRTNKTLQGEGRALGNLGNIYQSLGNHPKAINYYEQHLAIAQEINHRADVGIVLHNLGNAYLELGNYAKAINYSERSLVITREFRDRPGEGSALNNLGASLLQLDKLTEAEAALRSSIAVWESLRTGLTDADKVSLAETQSTTYRLLQNVLVRQKRPDAALEVAEQGRSRAFAELLASRLQAKSIAEIQAIAKPPNLEGIRRIAKTQNATLVEYSIINQSTLYIWVIKPTGEITFHTTALDAKVPIAKLVENSRSAIAVRGQDSSSTAATTKGALNQLHKLLIAPIIADLPQDPNQRIIFLPQGPLFLVPFAALQDDQGQYLIDQHTLSTAPSIQTLQLTHEKAKLAQTNGNKLIVGDPTMPLLESGQLPDLPGARQEAIDIAKILNTQPLLGAQATKAAVVKQMPTAAVIHLATHGLLGDVKGDVPGAIVFAASGQDNGLLSASEIFDLKLKADLIVLSACDTGRGAITGDGVIGLSRSLIAAGAPSIVVSLWAVNDSSTSVLMSEFYRNLKTNPDKAQALRQAALTTKKQFPNPRDWAAFTLIGESHRD
jgi:CHAT domain-containing protein/lipopolysaccharide biosynthesis regulator YciM